MTEMSLPVEKLLYWAVWFFGVLYSLYRFCLTVNGVQNFLDPADFDIGWTFLRRLQDTSDIEWAVLTDAFKRHWMLLLLHAIFSQTGYFKRKQITLHVQAVYSIICLIVVVGPSISALYVLYVFIMYGVHVTRRKSICYGITIVSLYLLQLERLVKLREGIIPEKDVGFLSDVGFVWLIARCLSFSIDRINSSKHIRININDLSIVLSYCFYLPAVFIGPLITYDSYLEQVSHPNRNRPFHFKSLLHFIHPFCGFFLLELLLHYVYSSAVQFYPDVVSRFDSWSICGLGYALPTLFYLKYFVIYSFSGALAKIEQIELPPPPKCISRINVPSALWRTFDRGLYLWLLRYLYFPVVDGKWTCLRKVFALALSFSFICMWHGMDYAVCTWTILNFINVILEMTTSFIISTRQVKKYETYLSTESRKRLKSLIVTPHFIIMCISSCFFLSNWDIGHLVFRRIIISGWVPLLPTAFIMYCGCCVASDVKEWEENKAKLIK